MISRLEINGVHLDVEDDIKKYIHRKIGKLQRLIPRSARPSAHAKVVLSVSKNQPTCEVVLELPGSTLMAKESTINMFSSVDVVEAKLSRQIRKYKTTHAQVAGRKIVRKLIKRIQLPRGK